MRYLVGLGYPAELGVGLGYPAELGVRGCVNTVEHGGRPSLPAWGVENISDLHF